MIEEIRIRNFGIFEEVNLSFSEGFNVITGETGAGKSMLIGSLQFLLGGRASASMIKEGEKGCEVEALFHIRRPSLRKWLEEKGIELDEERLLVRRVFERDGRSRIYIGGSLSTVGLLKELGEELVEITGQGGFVELLKPVKHAEFLDAFCGAMELHRSVKEAIREIKEMKRNLEELASLKKERERKMETLRFELKEIEGASIKEGEIDELLARREVIKKGEKYFEKMKRSYELLYEGEGNVCERIGMVLKLLQELSGMEEVDEVIRGLSSVESEVREYARTIEGLLGKIMYDPEELERIEERITLIKKLLRKYGGSEKEVLEYATRISEELKKLEGVEEDLRSLEKSLEIKYEEMKKIADQLSEKRRLGAEKLSKEISKVLSELGMKGAKFVVHLEEHKDGVSFKGKWFSEHGAERVSFLFSSSPSGEPRPLEDVASGGELSRVLLAIKSAISYKEGVSTCIYDEIDTGVGGAVAEMIGMRLKLSSLSSQVICVTHLPQIAAYADRHILVIKEFTRKGEHVCAEIIEDERRIEELARMLSGIEKPESARKLAKELLFSARKKFQNS